MAAEISFRPVTFGRRGAVFALHDKSAHVIIAFACNPAVGERKVQVHAMFVLRLVIVETGPGAGRIHLVAHGHVVPNSSEKSQRMLRRI